VTFALRVRVPGWALGQPVPSDLYRYIGPIATPLVSLMVNGEPVAQEIHQGYVEVRRTWHAEDELELHLPMPVRRVVSHPAIADNAGRVALERGPLVYCAEWPDHEGSVFDLVIPDGADLAAEERPELLNGISVIRGEVQAAGHPATLSAIPYYAWSHRGAGEMVVWMKRS